MNLFCHPQKNKIFASAVILTSLFHVCDAVSIWYTNTTELNYAWNRSRQKFSHFLNIVYLRNIEIYNRQSIKKCAINSRPKLLPSLRRSAELLATTSSARYFNFSNLKLIFFHEHCRQKRQNVNFGFVYLRSRFHLFEINQLIDFCPSGPREAPGQGYAFLGQEVQNEGGPDDFHAPTALGRDKHMRRGRRIHWCVFYRGCDFDACGAREEETQEAFGLRYEQG